MGLESQLTDVSSESFLIVMFANISNCVCYLRSRFIDILHRMGVLSPDQHHNPEEILEIVEETTYNTVGSGLANVVLLAEQLNLNRVFSYKHQEKKPDNDDEGSNIKCVVCLNILDSGDEVRKLACRHVFHKSCFDGWLDELNFNCPLCRAALISDERVECTSRLLGEDGMTWFSSLR